MMAISSLHSHNYNGPTSYAQGHLHYYAGITSFDPNVPGHIHQLVGYTTLNEGHVHYYLFETGPEIETTSGHYHYYKGVTWFADHHVHSLEGVTSVF